MEDKGHRSAAEHLAQISGRSLKAARSELETSTALPDLDATTEALLAGEVSEFQGHIIASAAKANPQAERNLIKKANHQQLRDEAQRAKAAADADAEARHRRIHAKRRLGRHTDLEGAWNLEARQRRAVPTPGANRPTWSATLPRENRVTPGASTLDRKSSRSDRRCSGAPVRRGRRLAVLEGAVVEVGVGDELLLLRVVVL